MTRWAETTESEIQGTIPFKPNRTPKQYQREVYRAIVRSGYLARLADYDNEGNCVICGEAGRCPGWHINE